MSGSNRYFDTQQLPTPSKEICSDPEKLALWLSKVQQRLGLVRRQRVVKCPNVRMAFGLPGFSVDETTVQIPNPGFQVGAVAFSHAIPIKSGDGSTGPSAVNGAGYLKNLKFLSSGGITFNPVIPSEPAPSAGAIPYYDVYVILMEGEGTVK